MVDQPFPLLGLSGGIAAGKSFVGRWLAARGWVLIDADALSRETVAPGSEGLAAVTAAFGPGVLSTDGSLDRAATGRLVFDDDAKRRALETILHPRIEALRSARLAALPPDTKGAVLDAALWVERGKAHHFDAFWTVDAPEDLREKRLMERDHFDEASARTRIRAQAHPAERALHADAVILNDGRDLDEILTRAEAEVLSNWRARRARAWRSLMDAPFSPDQLRLVLETLLSKGGAYAEAFVERRRANALGMDDGRMEDLLVSETLGVGLRVMEGETTRFADLISPSLDELIEAARTLAAPGAGHPSSVPALQQVAVPTPSPITLDPSTVPLADKVALVKRAEAMARKETEALRPGALRQVAVGFGDSTQSVWVASAEVEENAVIARLSEDRRVQGVLRLSITTGAKGEDGERLQTGYQALGETRGFELFADDRVEATVKEAARLAVLALDAQPAPAGTFPVVLSSRAGGTMIHEACGHGLEADLALAGMSAFAGKLG
ncbi:MAG TPA: dephospho-CoA kinase, partial [Holophagaceae bacterium]|nr:dephospho-CoA kinase [Holophagaceae bacterium]